MLTKSLLLFLTTKLILAQIDGEFWWLNGNLPHVRHIEAPKIEEDNAFETDDSTNIVFRDNKNKLNAFTVGDTKGHKREKWKIDAHFTEEDRIIYPGEYEEMKKTKYSVTDVKVDKDKTPQNKSRPRNEDEFKFYFPDDFLQDKDSNNEIVTSEKKVHDIHKDNMVTKIDMMASEHICSYMKKSECYQQNGLVYTQAKRVEMAHLEMQLVCCILPLMKEELSRRMIFPDSTLNIREKRSKQDGSISPDLKQRAVLLKRRFGTSVDKEKVISPKTASPDYDYSYNTDPYWNIKSSNSKSTHASTHTKNDCYEDYVEDYVVEVPKPGLLGVYSDHSRPGWPVYDYKGSSYGGNTDDDNYDDDDGPGYSTIDPRRDTTTSKFPKRRKPSKLSSVTEVNYDPESLTISYQSNPDFQVLQGFKLTNLAQNKNKFYSINSKKTTTSESVIEENSEESAFTDASSENLNKDFIAAKQIYRNCGRASGNLAPSNGKQLGSSQNGSHPWLALVVSSKRRQVILCYATIVHPRAALTAAECTYGKPSGEISLVAGVRDLKDRSEAQYRVVTTRTHPQYQPNDLAHNVAIMQWSRALKLTTNVQPACLGEPQATSDCFIYGWGGYDQAFRSRSRWQRTTVLSLRQCKTRLSNQSKNQVLPSGAFCAVVQARGTVTGIGGSLVCVDDGRYTAAGVAVWRDTVLVLLPLHGWPTQALETVFSN